MKAARRVLSIVALAAVVGVAWRWVGTWAWADTLDVASAGEQFTTWIEPLATLVGWLLVAVPGVILIRSAWGWLSMSVRGVDAKRIPRPR